MMPASFTSVFLLSSSLAKSFQLKVTPFNLSSFDRALGIFSTFVLNLASDVANAVISPPALIAPLTQIPPVITTEPVVVFVLAVLLLNVLIPPIVWLPVV